MICPNCHSVINDDAVFCSECGSPIIKSKPAPLRPRPQPKKDNKKIIVIISAAVLSLILIAGSIWFFVFSDSGEDNVADTGSSNTQTAAEKDNNVKFEITEEITIEVGESAFINPSKECTYEIENDSICEVDRIGAVIGLKAGKTKITCISVDGKELECEVMVEEVDLDDSDKYIFPNSSTTLLTESDLLGKTKFQLRNGINEIFARHHCTFKDEEIASYFSSKSWYTPDPNLTVGQMNADMSAYLNETELANINFIRTYQNTH